MIRVASGRRSLGLTAALVVAAPPGNQSPNALLLANVTVIDGRGGPPIPNQSILVRDGRIAAIGPAVSVKPPTGAETLDLTGRFVLPGLIDTHLHLPPDRGQVEARLAFLFKAGITSARDQAGDSHLFREVAAASGNAGVARAQLHYVAFWAGPTFFATDKRPHGSTQAGLPGEVPWFKAITDETDLDRAVTDAIELGAHALKLYSDLPLPVFQRAVEAGRRAGLAVGSHVAVFPIRPSLVITSGVTSVSHAALLVWEAVDSMPTRFHTPPATNFGPIGPYQTVNPDDPKIRAVLEEMRRRGVVLDATVSVIGRGISEAAAKWSLRATALAKRLGVLVSTGTDRPEEPSADRKPALFDEIELLVQRAGFTPLEAITAATRNGALALGIDGERGTVEPGKVADLIVVAANPSRDIRNLRRVTMVIKAGTVTRVE